MFDVPSGPGSQVGRGDQLRDTGGLRRRDDLRATTTSEHPVARRSRSKDRGARALREVRTELGCSCCSLLMCVVGLVARGSGGRSGGC